MHKSVRAFITELVGKDRIDEVLEDAKTDELPSPYDTLDAYNQGEVEELIGASSSPSASVRRRLNARLEELRIEEANKKDGL